MAKPVKTYCRRNGSRVSFALHHDGRLAKIPFLDGLTTYNENPVSLTVYDPLQQQIVARRAQVGDTVYNIEAGYGEVVHHLNDFDVVVQLRDGQTYDIASSELAVVHHNIAAEERLDTENLSGSSHVLIRSLEEAEFRVVRNHEHALNEFVKREEGAPLTVDELLQTHRRMFKEWSWGGRFRVSGEEVFVGRRSYRCVSADNIVSEMEAFLDFANSPPSGNDAFHHFARAYYEFCRIHPFRDGNGRMARMIVTDYAARHFNMLGILNVKNVGRFPSRNDRAFERARESDGKNIRDLTSLIKRLWTEF